jgi:hypothetical protein
VYYRVDIVAKQKFETECLVLMIFFDNLRFGCLVFVYWYVWKIYGCIKYKSALAARDIIDHIDGEGEVAQESVSYHGLNLCRVGFQFDVRDEDGGECQLRVGIANFCEHRMGQIE